MLLLEQIDFHDSSIERIEIHGSDALITVINWQEETVRIRLRPLLYFRCYEIPKIVESSVVHDSPEIREAIHMIQANGALAEGYNNFRLTQLNLENVVAVFVSSEVQKGRDSLT